VLEEVDIEVIQQQEISFRLIDDSASNEIRAELAIMDSTKTDRFKFLIEVWDTYAGLSEEEALVTRYDASYPILKREHALTKDNATEWYGASCKIHCMCRQSVKEAKVASRGKRKEREEEVLSQ
jgi:hypothetical protein